MSGVMMLVIIVSAVTPDPRWRSKKGTLTEMIERLSASLLVTEKLQ